MPISNASGIGSLTQNAGKLTNKGFELAVNLVPVQTKNFTWSINYNFTKLKSVVDDLAPGVANIFLGGFTTPNIRLVKGDEYGQIYGNAYQRDSKTNQMLIGANGLPMVTTCVQKIGNPNPKWLMGLTNTVSYKGLTLSVLVDIRRGGQQYSRNIKDLRSNGDVKETANSPRFNPDGSVNKPYVFKGVYANGLTDTTNVSAQDYWGNSGKYVAVEGENNVWSSINSTTLSDLELIIKKAATTTSPYYSGVAKILKAYEYQLAVDVWGDIPYTEAQQLVKNTAPHYDKGADINTAGVTFMASTADNFQMAFFNAAKQQNPIQQFEASRSNYLFANDAMVTLMNGKADPRRPFYFTPLPFNSSPATYKGVKPGDPVGTAYSRIHTYLRGSATGSPAMQTGGGITAGAYLYTGAAPIRMLTYQEYCFIRAEAALMGAPGDPQAWFTAGITASMQDAGVSAPNITTYLTATGTLTGTPAQQLQQIIEEKYVAIFGESIEPLTDFRRTGYPALVPPSDAVANQMPRSLFYPQSEIDLNANAPKQKTDMQAKVFWDN